MKEKNSPILPENRKAVPPRRPLSAISGKPSDGVTKNKTRPLSATRRASRPLRIPIFLSAVVFCLVLAAGCTGIPATPSEPVTVPQTQAAVTQVDHASAATQPASAANWQATPVPSGTSGRQPPDNRTGGRGSYSGQPPVMNASMISEMASRLETEGIDMSAVRAALASNDTDTARTLLQQFMESHRNEFPGPRGNMTPRAPP
jgi:hypothetical protein